MFYTMGVSDETELMLDFVSPPGPLDISRGKLITKCM
jgi:hypothetical protein